jgi:hypothetical protein
MKSKHVNILNERPRKKNNKILLNIGMCEKPAEPELNFWQACVVLVVAFLALFTLFTLTQRAMDIKALNNCELYGDCTEVIRHINGR